MPRGSAGTARLPIRVTCPALIRTGFSSMTCARFDMAFAPVHVVIDGKKETGRQDFQSDHIFFSIFMLRQCEILCLLDDPDCVECTCRAETRASKRQGIFDRPQRR